MEKVHIHARAYVQVSGDAQLDYDEFKACLFVLEVILPPAKVRQLFKLFDQDGSCSVLKDHRLTPGALCPSLPMCLRVFQG